MAGPQSPWLIPGQISTRLAPDTLPNSGFVPQYPTPQYSTPTPVPADASSSNPRPSTAFSLDSLSGALANEDALAEQRRKQEELNLASSQALNRTATQEATVVMNQSMQSAADTRKRQLEVLGGIDEQLGKAKTAMQLSQSQNPLDRLQLWALQQTDPSGFTRAGNVQRMQFLQAGSEALGTVEAIKQAGYSDMIKQIQNKVMLAEQPGNDKLATLALAEKQGQERIDASKNDLATKAGMLGTMNTMQDEAVQNLTPEQVDTALLHATNSPTGTANVGGVDISLAKLQDRQIQLEERSYNGTVLQQNTAQLALNNMTLPQAQTALSQAQGAGGQIMIGGIPMSAALIQTRIDALTDRDVQNTQNLLSINSQLDAQSKKASERVAATYNVPELQNLIRNGGIDAKTGQQFDLDIIQKQLAIKQQVATDQANQTALMGSLTDPAKAAADQMTYIESIKVDPQSPIAAQLAAQKSAVRIAATMLSDQSDPQKQAIAATIVAGSRAQVDALVGAEAKRLSAGDKDLENALNYQLRGQPIPADVTEQAVLDKQSSNKPIGNWLSGKNRSDYTVAFQAALSKLQSDSSYQDDPKALRIQAGEQAMDVVKANIAQGTSDTIWSTQTGIKGNPLNGVFSGSEFLSVIKQADMDGATQYQNETGLKQDEMLARMNGQINDPNFAAAQASALYQALEKKRPGLGKQYTDWWNSDARNQFVANYADATTKATQTFTQATENGLITPDLQGQMANYGAILGDGEKRALSSDLTRQHADFVTFGQEPTTKQVFLLQQTQGLTDTERKQAMTNLIGPLLAQAKAQGLDTSSATKFVEANLRTMQPQDSADRKLLQKVISTRDAALKIVDDFTAIQPTLVPFVNKTANTPAQMWRATANFSWWKDIQDSMQ